MTKVVSDAPTVTSSSIISRFAKLFTAQTIEGGLQSLFFIYLAWMDEFMFGEVQYAFAAASIVMKITQYGLYFPLVTYLGEAEEEHVPGIMNQANIIKIVLTVVTMLGLTMLSVIQGFSVRMSLIIFFMCLGYSLEQIVESYFASMRVQGQQGTEARIKATASLVSYGYGFFVIAIGLNPIIMSLYRILSTVIRLIFSLKLFLNVHPGKLFERPALGPVMELFKYASVFAFIQILGVTLNKTNIFFMEREVGVKGVAYYCAGNLTVDGFSIMASEQLLSWVIFPLLSVLWWKKREEVVPLVRRTALWLLAISFPLMFTLYAESPLIIGLLYPSEYKDSIWIQQTLVPCILFAFENNLFCFVMMVVGGVKVLLLFSIIGFLINLLLNATLIPAYGLLGACLVLICTKFVMMLQTSAYCQVRLRLFDLKDFLFPLILAGASLCLFLIIRPLISIHLATAITLGVYCLILWRLGNRFLGKLRKKEDFAGPD